MNKMLRLLALLVAMTICFACSAFAEEAASAENPVLATVNGKEIRQDTVLDILSWLYDNQYVSSETDYDMAVEYAVRNQVELDKIAELGLDQFTEEEKAAFAAEAQTQWDEAVDYYVQHYLDEDSDEARARLREEGNAYFTSQGFSVESLAESLEHSASFDRLQEYITQGKDTAATEEEIRREFESEADYQRSLIGNDIVNYEYYIPMMYGVDLWYVPEGYRGILHILLPVEEELYSAYESAQALYEESVSDENPQGSEELLNARDEAYQAVIASKQDVIDEIYARLENGESFEALIAEYGEDQGMTDESNLRNGYPVHAESIAYVDAFVKGAFSEKMDHVGAVSDPVLSQYGIHILYYLRDVPPTYVDLSDEISAQLEETIINTKINALYAEALEAWSADSEIVYNTDAIAALKAQAEAAAAEEEEEEEEAETQEYTAPVPEAEAAPEAVPENETEPHE